MDLIFLNLLDNIPLTILHYPANHFLYLKIINKETYFINFKKNKTHIN